MKSFFTSNTQPANEVKIQMKLSVGIIESMVEAQ